MSWTLLVLWNVEAHHLSHKASRRATAEAQHMHGLSADQVTPHMSAHERSGLPEGGRCAASEC